MEVLAEVTAEVFIELAGGTELEVRVKIRQPEELKVFDSLRLSVVVAAEIFAEIAAEIAAELLMEVAGGLGYCSQI